MPRVGIIGTAGRQGLDQQLNPLLFEKMVAEAHRIITKDWKLSPADVKLVSGGAAWADHVAVRLFSHSPYHYQSLVLHLPTRWNTATQRFSYHNKTGQAANYYHRLFSDALQGDSWHELQQAMDLGAEVKDHYDGFYDRNEHVAQQSEFLMAFTLDPGSEPAPHSGTRYTWSRCPGQRKHVSITNL